jgi:hypothetical protein
MPPRIDDRDSIKDDEDLLRRVIPNQACFQQSENLQWRPSSAVFLDRTNRELSVHRSSLTTPELVLAKFPYNSLVAIKASVPRELGCIVCPDPIKDDQLLPDDPSHALICEPPGAGTARIKTHAKQMSRKATWVVLRDPPC